MHPVQDEDGSESEKPCLYLLKCSRVKSKAKLGYTWSTTRLGKHFARFHPKSGLGDSFKKLQQDKLRLATDAMSSFNEKMGVALPHRGKKKRKMGTLDGVLIQFLCILQTVFTIKLSIT